MDFWDYHGYGFILCMFFFPRLTMLFATVCGGWLWWLGWFLAPRLTVAIIATTHFWQENTVLCVLTWLWALGLETAEKCKCETHLRPAYRH
jgi:hypothetical protein